MKSWFREACRTWRILAIAVLAGLLMNVGMSLLGANEWVVRVATMVAILAILLPARMGDKP